MRKRLVELQLQGQQCVFFQESHAGLTVTLPRSPLSAQVLSQSHAALLCVGKGDRAGLRYADSVFLHAVPEPIRRGVMPRPQG